MIHLRTWFLLWFSFMPPLGWAYTPEEGRVSATLGPLLYKTLVDPVPSAMNSPLLGGLGFLVNGDISQKGALEIGMFYLHKNYFRQERSQLQVERAKRMYITMGYRHWLNKKISMAGAFFSAYTMGDVEVIHSDFTPGQAVDTSAGEKTEYGFDFSLQWEFWSNAKFAGLADARYSWSVTDKPHEDSDHYGGLLALKYVIQEK